MRPAGIYKNRDLLTYISRSADFRLWLIFMFKIFVIGRFLSSADSSELIFYLCVGPTVSAFMPRVHARGVGLEVNI